MEGRSAIRMTVVNGISAGVTEAKDIISQTVLGCLATVGISTVSWHDKEMVKVIRRLTTSEGHMAVLAFVGHSMGR